ncbi:MAG TPA: phosphotriesterase-related protein [Dehalococcoidia bacterium]|nr:phosphotriesterase-related protein [Dehalococcoidia bacterium]
MTGPVATSDLGFTLMHEHIIVQAEGVVRNFPSVWDEQAELDKAVETLTTLKARGVDTIVDPTVLGIGRDVPRLLPVVEKAGIQVVVATGLYTFNELPSYFLSREIDEMAGLFVADITDGIQGTNVKAAILKCATDAPGVTPGVEKVLRAVARAHLRTGAPITTHTHAATQRGLDQQRVFAEEGVDLTRVIIGHSGDSEDLDYLTKLLDAGSYIGMDRFGLDIFLPEEKRIATVAALCRMGHTERMVLSHDAMVYFDMYKPEVVKGFAPNWSHYRIVDHIIPALLEAGVSQAQIDAMTRKNPRRIFENVRTY